MTPRQLAASPLMHGTAGIGALMHLFAGGAVVSMTSRSLDTNELWRTVEEQRCTTVSIVGDVFCAPMVDELDRRADTGDPVDLTSVRTVTSSGVMWSQPVKERLLAHARTSGSALSCYDSLGSSEGVGFAGKQSSIGGDDTETATFALGPNAAVFTPDGRRVEPGSDEPGQLAVGGPIPLGYYGDPVKSAETFREIDGRRWSIPGDWATVAADGTITLLGRGSVSINTGGEKVFPEEIEEELKLLSAVNDVNVVGVPDPKWGSAVTAVVRAGRWRGGQRRRSRRRAARAAVGVQTAQAHRARRSVVPEPERQGRLQVGGRRRPRRARNHRLTNDSVWLTSDSVGSISRRLPWAASTSPPGGTSDRRRPAATRRPRHPRWSGRPSTDRRSRCGTAMHDHRRTRGRKRLHRTGDPSVDPTITVVGDTTVESTRLPLVVVRLSPTTRSGCRCHRTHLARLP